MSVISVVSQPDGPSPVQFNPMAPELITDPYPLYRRLLQEDPVHLSPMGAWVLTRYADVAAVLRDPRFGRAGFQDFMLATVGPGPVQAAFSKWMLFLDPPDHSRLRTLVSQAFTPRTVEGMRPHIQELVDGLLDPIQDAGSMDLMEQFAYPLPVLVICEMLGVPAEDHEQFHDWSFALALTLDFPLLTPEIAARGNEAAHGLTEVTTHVGVSSRSERS